MRKLFLSIGLVAVLLGGSAAIIPNWLWGDHADYSHVVSIRAAPEYQEPDLLEKAWALPVASLYRKDIDFQRNPSFCGPTSVVNVLRSLHQPGDQAAILQGTGLSSVLGFLPGGITLDQLADLVRAKVAQKGARKVSILRDLDRAGFLAKLRHANDSSRRYVVNFSRGPLFGKGGGHFSPIAGYLVEEDLVLVLDVNRDYGPWLVKSDRLYDAMNTFDATSQKKRGLLLIE